MRTYELTVEYPNGDWTWERQEHADFHSACIAGLALAHTKRCKLVSVLYIEPKYLAPREDCR